MQIYTKPKIGKYDYTQNRELSWLKFNERVLEEADDKSVPLMERFKFISIFSSNLDEFFMVRVGSLFDLSQITPNDIDNKSGMTPKEQIEKIYKTIPQLLTKKEKTYNNLMAELNKHDICDVSYNDLKANERKFVNSYYLENILPVISPIIIGSHHPIPHLLSKNLYVTTLLKSKKNKSYLGIISIPTVLPKYIFIANSNKYIRIENIILQWASTLFGEYITKESTIISITRNADISFDNEKFEDNDENFRSHVEALLKKRNNLSIIRMELNNHITEEFLEILCKSIGVTKNIIFYDSTPLNMSYVFSLASDFNNHQYKNLLYPKYTPKWPQNFIKGNSIIDQVRQKDKLLFYPFDSVEPFLQLLTEAATRKDVVSIKVTIYRLASSSKIAHTLCLAAENGKEVIVLMELRARFDEAHNIEWSKMLEDSGCQVVYGIEEYKCHSKICLITLKQKGKLNHITQIGTGNYNEKTNEMYTDLSLLTASNEIGIDGEAFFKNILVDNLKGDYKNLLVAPYGIKTTILSMINREIKKGSEGYIVIKANSITERSVIDKLKEASDAGVYIHLIIRGVCCIVPEISRTTNNIHITSIVGRYLEHARIYIFGKDEDEKIFISSADLMTRNLNRRVEIACPIYDLEIKEQLKWIISVQLNDNVKASKLLSDGSYTRLNSFNNVKIDSQQVFMEKSIHKESSEFKADETLIEKIINKLLSFFNIGKD